MYESSYISMLKFENKYLKPINKKLDILDIGSQDINGSYKPIFKNKNYNYFGADQSEGKNVDIILDNPYDWKKLKSNSFDVVISGQAFEHIEYFWITMSEVIRVLKNGGICCIIAPSSGFEHKFPLDCWRIFPDGFKAIARMNRLTIMDCYMFDDFESISDTSETWKDSVLIAKKNLSFKSIIRNYFINKLLKKTI